MEGKNKTCKYFLREGGCKRGDDCKFVHVYPFLYELSKGTKKYEELIAQFLGKEWNSKSKRPWVHKIFVVRDETRPMEAAHKEYCEKIGNVRVHNAGVNPGNQQRRFHQSNMLCDFDGKLCEIAGCGVCNIIRTGFQMKYVGAGAGSWYGRGLYSTSQPSTAWKYGNKKGMFVVNVACGNADQDATKNEHYELPGGHHSHVVDHASDELVVFDDAAIVPRYLMIFDDPKAGAGAGGYGGVA